MSGNGQTDRQTRSLVPLSAASFLSHRWKPFYRTQRAEECEGGWTRKGTIITPVRLLIAGGIIIERRGLVVD